MNETQSNFSEGKPIIQSINRSTDLETSFSINRLINHAFNQSNEIINHCNNQSSTKNTRSCKQSINEPNKLIDQEITFKNTIQFKQCRKNNNRVSINQTLVVNRANIQSVNELMF